MKLSYIQREHLKRVITHNSQRYELVRFFSLNDAPEAELKAVNHAIMLKEENRDKKFVVARIMADATGFEKSKGYAVYTRVEFKNKQDELAWLNHTPSSPYSLKFA